MTAAYKTQEPGATFSFCAADGSDITVTNEPYETDDPGVIAYLDQTRFVKRVDKKTPKGDD